MLQKDFIKEEKNVETVKTNGIVIQDASEELENDNDSFNLAMTSVCSDIITRQNEIGLMWYSYDL